MAHPASARDYQMTFVAVEVVQRCQGGDAADAAIGLGSDLIFIPPITVVSERDGFVNSSAAFSPLKFTSNKVRPVCRYFF